MIRYHARWVLPVSAPAIEDGVVAVENGRIAYVGPESRAPKEEGADEQLGESLLMPGLVNAHTHLELTVMRGFLEDLDFARWIMRLNRVKREVLDRDQMLDGARLGLEEGLLAGITTYADTCDTGVAFDAMLEAGVRGIVYQEVFGPDPAACDESLEQLRAKVEGMRASATELVRVGVSPHAPYTVSDALYAATAKFAEREQLPIAVHIAESEHERQLVERGEGVFAEGLRKRGISVSPRARSSVELLEKNGVLAQRPLMIHCVRAHASDVASIARNHAPVAHCPISNAKLGHGTAPLVAMLEAGITVALGTDSVASNNKMDLLAEARAAILAQRAAAARHDVLCAKDALRLATLDGARALGLEREIGSLEVGKSADLVAFALDASAVPVHDPDSAAVFALPGARATRVLVAGRELVRDGQLARSDAGLTRRVHATAATMRAWATTAQ